MLYDVVIAGAGPVGLFLSCELAQAGCSVLLLEQAASPETPLKRLPFGLRGLNAPTLEALDRRGLLDAVAASQVLKPDNGAPPPGTAHWLAQPRPLGGHFAGIPLRWTTWTVRAGAIACRRRCPPRWRSSCSRWRRCWPSVRCHWVCRSSVAARCRRCTHAKQMVVQTGRGLMRGRWLVGCDGARSTVRKQSGFVFAGTAPEFTGHTLQVELADPSVLVPGRQFTEHGMCNFNPPGMLALADFDGGAGHRTPLDRHTAQALLRRVSGREATITALHLATTWTDAARQATAYRSGRVLLAGDAAHMHSPLGGQGLNLGIGDAMNLGWKLAAVVRGDVAESLLDSYQAERHPIGAQVLDWSRAQVALMRPGPGRARWRRSSPTWPRPATVPPISPSGCGVWRRQLVLDGSHPLVGRSAPDVQLADDRRMGELLRAGQGVLLGLDTGDSLGPIIERWQRSVTCVMSTARDTLGLGAVLVRPDGIVAWACDAGGDTSGLEPSLERWFGSLR
jgi:2-polyprenyl-6-methoxyphenol hydroxylase-like FAD-dependent oxidoreductase